MAPLQTTLCIIIVQRVDLNKLSRNVLGALRTTTTNCRVSFIEIYLVFPINFRMVFLPHTNTVITDPGLPVSEAPADVRERFSEV